MPLCPESIPLSENTHFRVITPEMSSEQCKPCSDISELRVLMTQEATDETAVTVRMESDTAMMEAETIKAGVAEARMACDMEETVTLAPGKTDSPSKRKGNVAIEITHNIAEFM